MATHHNQKQGINSSREGGAEGDGGRKEIEKGRRGEMIWGGKRSKGREGRRMRKGKREGEGEGAGEGKIHVDGEEGKRREGERSRR